ncbi:hypothetical protein [Pseudovibrio sp. SPO723]|uniref:hypothetical protein n=1 Tax=Nesiotobacter zosterae TaxID=392721 RepID=UPI0029C4B09C|nr:hypothetical protein [Pseudovibrio sp. SPO723]MDX5592549.1 hypothetical protein [Pseudovibrio sp. SPO723]
MSVYQEHITKQIERVKSAVRENPMVSFVAQQIGVSESLMRTWARNTQGMTWVEFSDSVLKEDGAKWAGMSKDERFTAIREGARIGISVDHLGEKYGVTGEHINAFMTRSRSRPYGWYLAEHHVPQFLRSEGAVLQSLGPYIQRRYSMQDIAKAVGVPPRKIREAVHEHYGSWDELCSAILGVTPERASFIMRTISDEDDGCMDGDEIACKRHLRLLEKNHGSGDKYELDIPAQYHMKMSAVQELQERFYEPEERARAA